MEIQNNNQVLVNMQDFKLVTNPNASFEDYGWTPRFVDELLEMAADEEEQEWLEAEDLNDLGIIYSESIGVDRDMQKAIMFYERAVELDDDLARSNLADIYRKGMNGVAVDHKKAFELYSDCKLPYAYYRVGEYYETGRAGITDQEEAKRYYRIAYKAGHNLARKKLETFDFMK